MKPASTVAQQLAHAFRRHGVQVTFGQSLPSAFQLSTPAVGIRQIAYRQENAGGAMADGYARISGKVGVVTAQNGPAAALLVAPLAEALKVSVPIVALVQEVSRGTADRNAFQELDHARLFAACSKWVRTVESAARIDDYVDMAFTVAASGRPGPAVLLVPADLLNDPAASPTHRTASLGTFPLDRTAPDPSRIEEAADLLAAARSALIVAGGGVHLSGAAAELAALQERHHIPVATTVMGKGAVDETHPLSLGVIGYFMGSGARGHGLRDFVRQADVILLVGNRTNQNGTDSWQLFPEGARYIHLDVDGAEVGRNYEALRLVGDAKLGLAALAEALARRDGAHRAARRSEAAASIDAGAHAFRSTVAAALASEQVPIRPERVMRDIDSVLTPDTIVVADASYSSIWIANFLTAQAAGSRFLTPRGLAGLGWGLPLAIGAKIARPGSPVICVVGDGGFAHSWAELETLARLDLPVTVVVLNNQVLGYQKDAEDVKFGEHTKACYFSPVDHAAIARACGCAGLTIREPREFLPALRDSLVRAGPTLLDIITDPEARPPISFFEGRFESFYVVPEAGSRPEARRRAAEPRPT